MPKNETKTKKKKGSRSADTMSKLKEATALTRATPATLKTALATRAVDKAVMALEEPRKSKKTSPKKDGGGFLKFLKGAAKVAAEVAPFIIPLILAKHGPTMLAMQAQGVAKDSPAHQQLIARAQSQAQAPLAYGLGGSIRNALGNLNRKTRSQGGRVIGETVSGVDFLQAVVTPGTCVAGTNLVDIMLSPVSSAFMGSRLASIATTYERYEYKKLAIIYEPVCDATEAGAVIGFIDIDPTDSNSSTGPAAVRAAASHAGMSQTLVWQMGLFSITRDNRHTDLFIDANGSDVRFTQNGRFFLEAASSIATSTAIGNLYIAFEVDLRFPQSEDSSSISSSGFARILRSSFTSSSVNNPWGTVAPDVDYQSDSTFIPRWYFDGSFWWLQGLPIGQFYMLVVGAATAVTVPNIVASSAAVGSVTTYVANFANAGTTTAMYMAIINNLVEIPLFPSSSTGYRIGMTTWTTPTSLIVHINARPSITALSREKKRKTLQDYEKDIDDLRYKIELLEAGPRQLPPPEKESELTPPKTLQDLQRLLSRSSSSPHAKP